MSSIRVELVTPVHNRKSETLQCLKSIERCDKTGLDLHVIVVDDGSTDGTSAAISEQYPDVEIISGDGNLWYTAGTNRGLEAALKHDPKYILAFNNDTIFDEQCILRMVECAEKYQKSVVGALLLNWEMPHKVFQVSPRWEFWKGGFRHWHHQTVWTVPNRPWNVDVIVGNCVLYPSQAVKDVGFMDEKRLVQYGDAEYTPRMKRHGWRLLIEPAARAFCKPNDPNSGFRTMPLRQQIKLLVDPASSYSLQRRFYANMGGAPTRAQGLLATPVQLVRYFLGMNQEGSWAFDQEEQMLSSVFESAVADD